MNERFAGIIARLSAFAWYPVKASTGLAAPIGALDLARVNVSPVNAICLLPQVPTIHICTPISLPIAQQFGMDPLQFGILMLINRALGLNTPPVGTVQFVGCAIGGVSVGAVMRTIWPFYGTLGLCLLLVTYVPAFSLWLPGLVK